MRGNNRCRCSYKYRANITERSVAVVVSDGVVLNGIRKATLVGAETISVVDISEDKLKLARQLGAIHTINANDSDHTQQLKGLINGGVGFAIDLAGL